ncbi:MAG: right-handed parallel beta-helix repeat-containing protein [Candidatus Omnitrophica bacterium]|nr:right-handed parallel beta-helix repeat-containing protein [Candidatus Omnitrophota bacterium]
MRKLWSFVFTLTLAASTESAFALELFVAPNGSDANPGTFAQPFATPEKARDTIRTLNTPPALFAGNPQWVAGKDGSALRFDGVADYIATRAVRLFGQPSFSMWVNFTAQNPGAAVVKDYPLICQDNATTKPETYLGFQWNKGVLSLKADFFFNGINASEAVAVLDPVFVLNQWIHVVATYNGYVSIIYVNGIKIGSSSSGSYNPMSNNSWLPWIIGARPMAQWTSAYFQGAIDEVRIYNRALTSDEAVTLAGTVGAGTTLGLVHYWKLNDSIGRAAQDEIKQPFNGATVYFRGGMYDRSQSFDLGTEDSGVESGDIVYRAYGNEKVIWSGAKTVSGFHAVTDNTVLNRFDAAVRDHVQQADLKTLGITDFGMLHGRTIFYPADNSNALELFYKDQPTTLARWPNKGNGWEKVDPMIPEYTYDAGAVIHPLAITSISNTTPVVVTTAVNHFLADNDQVSTSAVACSKKTFSVAHSAVKVLGPNSFTLTDANSMTSGDCPANTGTLTPLCKFRYRTNRPDRWMLPQDIWIHGYFSVDYKDYREKVSSVDRATKIMRTDPSESYGIEKPWKYKGTQGGRYFYENVLEELDSPGEWYLDRTSGILYFWPPAALQTADASVSVLKTPFVTMTNVAHVMFSGIEFTKGRSAGMRVYGGGYNTIKGCRLLNFNADGITIDQSLNNTIQDSEIGYTAAGGVLINAGDRKTLMPGDNLVSNNEIHHFGQISGLTFVGVCFTGVGNRAEHNLIHHGPNSGIDVTGNDHIVAYNDIHHIAQEASEVGGICSHGNLYTLRGTKIMYNYIHDSVIDSNAAFPLELWGIVFDGLPTEQTVFGNIFVNLPRNLGVSGRSTSVSNNIVFNANGNPGFTADEFTDSSAITALISKITGKGIVMPGGTDDIDNLNNLLRTPGLRTRIAVTSIPSQAAELIKREASLSEYELMQLNRYFLYKAFPQCPQGHFGVTASQWQNFLPKEFDGTPPSDPTLYNDMLFYKFDQPPYSTRYPELATTWGDQPSHAKYNKITNNILISPNPLDLINSFTRLEDFYTGDPSSATANDTTLDVSNNFISGDPHFKNYPPKTLADFELRDDSPIWASGFQRIPIDQIGLLSRPSILNSLGDVSGNGAVTIYDAALTLRGGLTQSQGEQADVNGDGTVDAKDAYAIAKKAIGIK